MFFEYAAIVVPVLERSRVASRRQSCMSNLKQFGLALNMYTQCAFECFPSLVGSNEKGKLIKLKAGDGLDGLYLLYTEGYKEKEYLKSQGTKDSNQQADLKWETWMGQAPLPPVVPL